MPEELARQPERLARLKQEACILASLNHPGIATLHGLEESDGCVPVLAMELVEGEALAERLRRGPLPPREALRIAHQIALALEAAHEKGVLHRDLKPANTRLAPDGRVKLLDFGLAEAVQKAALDSRLDTQTSPHSEAGTVLGTAPYMSPEQARGQEADRRSDIWAFGCVLYEMLSGKRAFPGATFSETVASLLDREPDWQALPQETPAAALRLLRRCLQKEKDRRVYTATDTNTRGDIWILPLERDGGEPRVFLQAPAYEGMPAISPNGRVVAYESDESGQVEVYLRSFPDGGSKIQVSSGGGFNPVWARSGRELFHRARLEGAKRQMMVVDREPGNSDPRFSRPPALRGFLQ